jgi:hypothetical protein
MKELIGKKIKGFKFEETDCLPYNNKEMDNYIGKVGVITKVRDEDVRVKFEDDNYYFYPLSEALNHIVEKHPQRGDEVLVWDIDESKAEPRIFLAYIERAMYPVQVVHGGCEKDYKNGNHFDTDRFKFYKLPPQKTNLTLQQIADKFGIDVKSLEVQR